MRKLAGAVILGFLLACGGSLPEEPTPDPADVRPPAAVAPSQPAAPAPRPTAQEYPGNFEGICIRMEDCGCSNGATRESCLSTVSFVHSDTPAADLKALANASCRVVCATPSSLHIDLGADGTIGTEIRIQDGAGTDLTIETSAGPDGAGIMIEDHSVE